MSFELSLAWRYFRSRRHHPFIAVIRAISVLGVAVGVAALVVVLGVMNGFEKDLKERIIGVYAHAVVEADAGIEDAQPLRERVRTVSGAAAVAPFVQGQALIERGKAIEGVLVKGAVAGEEEQVSAIGNYLTHGAFPRPGANELLLGDALADVLRVETGDTVRIVSSDRRNPVEARVSGIFHSGMYEYDAHLVYAPLELAQGLFAMGTKVTGLSVRFRDPEEAERARRVLQLDLGYPYYVRTWTDMNRNLFGALKLEKAVMFVILTLIVTVACFNIAGTLTLLVIDRTKDIGVLRSLGATGAQVRRLFTLNGLFIGTSGTALGLALGLGLAAALDRFPLVRIPSDIYYFSRLPVEIAWPDVGWIAAAAVALAFLSTLYPAAAGASLKAVEALRYE